MLHLLDWCTSNQGISGFCITGNSAKLNATDQMNQIRKRQNRFEIKHIQAKNCLQLEDVNPLQGLI